MLRKVTASRRVLNAVAWRSAPLRRSATSVDHPRLPCLFEATAARRGAAQPIAQRRSVDLPPLILLGRAAAAPTQVAVQQSCAEERHPEPGGQRHDECPDLGLPDQLS